MKHTVLALSSLERTMARQRSRVRWLKEGDTNSRLFHTVANGRRQKNFILVIRHNGELVTNHQKKEEIFFETYNSMLVG